MTNYVAVFDDGHDYHEMEFESTAGIESESLRDEAISIARRKYGRIANGWKLDRIMKWEIEDEIEDEIEGERLEILEELKKEFGIATYEDKEYILLEQAEIDEDNFGNCIFIAKAIHEEDEVDMYGYQAVYEMIWYPCDDFNPSVDEDFGDACDWDSPNKLEKLNVEYDVENKEFS